MQHGFECEPLRLQPTLWRRKVKCPSRVVIVLTVLGFGCAWVPVDECPLVDLQPEPTILVERRSLTPPDRGPGTRFVSSWLFTQEDRGFSVRPVDGRARLEIVQLASRPRRLTLRTAADPTGLIVSAAAGPRELETVTTPAAIEVSLPRDLPTGRMLIDLEFEGDGQTRFTGALLDTAVMAGSAVIDGADVVQAPWSMTDFVFDNVPGSVLRGEFFPPPGPGAGQRFTLVVERSGERAETVFESPAAGSRDHRPAGFEIPLGVGPSVRVRLSAEGRGGAGRWRNLRVVDRGRVTESEIAPPSAPRVVLVYVMDALRADAVGHLGDDGAVTPCLDRLAAEGAVFTNHFSVAPNTGPATSSLFTGYGFLRGRSIPKTSVPTLAGDFAGAGYRTVSISSNPHLAPSFGLIRGFDDVLFVPIDEDFATDGRSTVNDSADRVHAAALDWLDGAGPEERLFLYLHTINPHNPYTPPEPFPTRFVMEKRSTIDATTKTLATIRDGRRKASEEDRTRIREWYEASVAYNDAALCGLLDRLDTRFGDEMLVAVTSDHGEELFDHGGVLHGHTLYDELLHVPLIIRWRGRVEPGVFRGATGTLDLTESLRELIGTERQLPGGGRSLWPLIDGAKRDVKETALHFATAPGLHRAAMARSAEWKLILAPRPRFAWGMGQAVARTHDAEYVFDLVRDPEERTNLAGSGKLEVDRLRARLAAWLEGWEKRQPKRADAPLDGATRRRLKALGYTD